jgi:hypothetical protein
MPPYAFMAWIGTAEMLSKKENKESVECGRVEVEVNENGRNEERKRDRRVGAGKEEMPFSGVTVGPRCYGPDPLCCEGICGSTGQCLRLRSL